MPDSMSVAFGNSTGVGRTRLSTSHVFHEHPSWQVIAIIGTQSVKSLKGEELKKKSFNTMLVCKSVRFSRILQAMR